MGQVATCYPRREQGEALMSVPFERTSMAKSILRSLASPSRRARRAFLTVICALIVLPGASAHAQDIAIGAYGLQNGALDSTFGTGGKVNVPFPNAGGGFEVSDVAVDYAQRIIVVGSTNDGAIGVARFLPNGGLDPTFGVGGSVKTAFPGSSTANAVAIGLDSRIIVAGQIGGQFALLCYQ